MNNFVLIIGVFSFLLGYNIGYIKCAMDFDKIIDTYKDTIKIYRNILGLP